MEKDQQLAAVPKKGWKKGKAYGRKFQGLSDGEWTGPTPTQQIAQKGFCTKDTLSSPATKSCRTNKCAHFSPNNDSNLFLKVSPYLMQRLQKMEKAPVALPIRPSCFYGDKDGGEMPQEVEKDHLIQELES